MLQELSEKLISQIGEEKKRLEEEKRDLEDQARGLKRDRSTFEEEKLKMSAFGESQKAARDVVEVNVGGEVMTTKRGTLLLPENTLLEAMFSGRWEESLDRDAAGRVFLDFSPTPFRALLSHLRVLRCAGPGKHVRPPNVPPEYRAEFDSMIRFLGLRDFVYSTPMCSAGALECPCVNAVDRRSVTMSLGEIIIGGSDVPIIGKQPLLGRLDEAWWKIAVDELNGCLHVGIVLNEYPTNPSFNDATCYCWVSNNSIYQAGKFLPRGDAGDCKLLQGGDIAIFKLDSRSSLLCMYRLRKGHVDSYSMRLQDSADVRQMRLYINIDGASTVKVLPATPEEIADLS